MKTIAVIMAGGKGERFWPKSRNAMPKQFLSLTDDGLTMIQQTAIRLLPMVDYADMYVVTNRLYVSLVQKQLPQIPPENILVEPMGKNTAPCIGFAATVIEKKYGDAVMLVLASDHLIKNTELFLENLAQATELAQEGENLVTLGITPIYPETGYGYIHFGKDDTHPTLKGIFAVKRFVEKPDTATAKEYLASGDYLWNSGMFVWTVSTIMERFRELLPDTHRGLMAIREALDTPAYEDVLTEAFEKFASESIDYGIMERATNIYTIPGNFGWNDVGSWLTLSRINQTDDNGNFLQGSVVAVQTKNSTVVGAQKLIATVGLENIIIVDTEDALLVMSKEHSQDIKKTLEILKKQNHQEIL